MAGAGAGTGGLSYLVVTDVGAALPRAVVALAGRVRLPGQAVKQQALHHFGKKKKKTNHKKEHGGGTRASALLHPVGVGQDLGVVHDLHLPHDAQDRRWRIAGEPSLVLTVEPNTQSTQTY